MPSLEVGGATLELPEGATQAAIKAAIADFRASPEFDAIIDKESGAPARVRAIVGSAAPKDKIINLQRFYPDAIAYGEDNYVFTDPGTGRATLFNPKGFDVGDVAGVGREITQGVGATLGATFGGLGGFVVGAPGGPPGMVAAGGAGAAMGSGLGMAAGGTLFDISMNLIAGRTDTRSLIERTGAPVFDFFAGASGQRFGELIGIGAKAAIGGVKGAARRLVDAFKSLRIEPPAGAVSGSRAVQTVEKTLEASPFSADVMQKQATAVLEQTRRAANRVAEAFGRVQTKQGAGATIRQAAVNTSERFGFTQEKAYAEAFDLVGADTGVVVNSVTALRKLMQSELARAPQSLRTALSPAIAKLQALEADAGAEGIAFAALRQVRTMIGKDIASPMLAGSSGARNEALKRLYGALTEDMSAAAAAAGPKAARKLAVADRFTRAFMNTAAKTMEKINRFDADERAFEFALSAARDGGTALARLRRNFTADEWDTIAGTVLGRLGLARPGAQDAAGKVFSPSTFMTNWNRLAPEAKEALFGGKRYADLAPVLDKLVKVVSSLKEVERVSNTSNTARTLITHSVITSFGAALGGFAGGDVESAAGGAAVTLIGAVVAPRAAARLITSPRFVTWLITPITKPNALSAHLGRLTAIVAAEPEIREEVEQFVAALRAAPGE